MKKWFKKYGGYLGGTILFVIGAITLNLSLGFSDIVGRFVFTIMGIISVGMSGTIIGLQYIKNNKEYIVKKQDLKFEDNTKPYEKTEEISDVVHSTKNYINIETKEDEKDLEL